MQICLIRLSINWWVISFLTSLYLCFLPLHLLPSLAASLPPLCGRVSLPLAVQGVLVCAELRCLAGRQVHCDGLRGQEGHGVRGGVLSAGTRWEETGQRFGEFSFCFVFCKRKGKGKKLDCSWSSLHQRLQQHRPLRLSPPDLHPESSLPLPLLAAIEATVEAPKCPLPHPPFHFQPEDEAW